MLNQTGYGVAVSSMMYNGVQILDFAQAFKGVALLSILDTGSSCVMLPNSTYNGTYSKSPYQVFHEQSTAKPGMDIEITFGLCDKRCDVSWNAHLPTEASRCCKTLKIPAKNWQSPRGCVQAFQDMNVMTLGDPIFRCMLVLIFPCPFFFIAFRF
jgi:hypothetical protein